VLLQPSPDLLRTADHAQVWLSAHTAQVPRRSPASSPASATVSDLLGHGLTIHDDRIVLAESVAADMQLAAQNDVGAYARALNQMAAAAPYDGAAAAISSDRSLNRACGGGVGDEAETGEPLRLRCPCATRLSQDEGGASCARCSIYRRGSSEGKLKS
jgi:hypothetical protein